jgi:Protein of unknown function (DUF1569)
VPRRSLVRPADADAILARLERVTPDAGRRWGTMTPNEMLCHLTDAFRVALGERHPPRLGVFGLRGAVPKWFALSVPLPWPHGIRGPAEVDPRQLGTKPAELDADRTSAVAATRRFIAEASDQQSHPMFGPMSRADWLRWGWLHLDHHLRQFGL